MDILTFSMSTSLAEQTAVARAIDQDGWAVTAPVVPDLELDQLTHALAALAETRHGRGGARNLLQDLPSVAQLALSRPVRAVGEAVLGPQAFAVRALFFDKTAGANWKVIWHQDLTIAVEREAHVEGYGPWSIKDGVSHVQPPVAILEQMLAVRIHLDACGPDNGPVRVLSGSHRGGRLSATVIDGWRVKAEATDCLVQRGGILAFRPLILHASSPATVPSHRRVIHIEFAAAELPAPLNWYQRIASE